jgi:hypothetical protein
MTRRTVLATLFSLAVASVAAAQTTTPPSGQPQPGTPPAGPCGSNPNCTAPRPRASARSVGAAAGPAAGRRGRDADKQPSGDRRPGHGGSARRRPAAHRRTEAAPVSSPPGPSRNTGNTTRHGPKRCVWSASSLLRYRRCGLSDTASRRLSSPRRSPGPNPSRCGRRARGTAGARPARRERTGPAHLTRGERSGRTRCSGARVPGFGFGARVRGQGALAKPPRRVGRTAHPRPGRLGVLLAVP